MRLSKHQQKRNMTNNNYLTLGGIISIVPTGSFGLVLEKLRCSGQKIQNMPDLNVHSMSSFSECGFY